MTQKTTTVLKIWLSKMLCLVSVLFDQYGNIMINYQSPIPKIVCYVYWRFVYFRMISVSLLH